MTGKIATNPPGHRAGWCIHYCGPPRLFSKEDHVCKAGVNITNAMAAVKFDERPCFLDKGKSKPNAATCEHLRLPTQEEIREREDWQKKRMDDLGKALAAVAPYRKTHRGKSDSIPCPVCGSGTLSFSIAASNGHVNAACSTEGCVTWIE